MTFKMEWLGGQIQTALMIKLLFFVRLQTVTAL